MADDIRDQTDPGDGAAGSGADPHDGAAESSADPRDGAQDDEKGAAGGGKRPAARKTGTPRRASGQTASRRKPASTPRSRSRATAAKSGRDASEAAKTGRDASVAQTGKAPAGSKTGAKTTRGGRKATAEAGASEAGEAGKAAPKTTRKRAPAKRKPAGKAEPGRTRPASQEAKPPRGATIPAVEATAEAVELWTWVEAAETPVPPTEPAVAVASATPAIAATPATPAAQAVPTAAEARAARSRPRAARARSVLAPILVVMAVLAVAAAVLAVWTHDLVFDTDTYVKTVAPIYDDPAARHAVSVYVADKAVDVSDVSSRIEKALPDRVAFLAGPLTEQLRQFLIGEIDRFLATDVARKLWVNINRVGHEQLVSALQDENRYVTVGKKDVTLNLVPLVAVALQKLDARMPDILGKDVQLPAIDPDTPPGDIRLQLQDALGRELPKGFGSITVVEGSQGYEAKRALSLFNDLVILVVVLAVALTAVALLVSVRRSRTALQLGLGVLLAFVIARVVERQAEKAIAGAVESQNGVAVTRAVVTSFTHSLNGFFTWVVVAAAIVVVIAFLAGRRGWLEAMGRGFSKLFRASSDLKAPDTRAGRWIGEHLDLLRTVGVVVAVVVLLFTAGSLTAVLAVVLVLIAYELALAVYGIGLTGPPEDAEGEPRP